MFSIPKESDSGESSQAKSKILVTGGCGLIGSNLYKKLVKDDRYDVYVLDCVETKPDFILDGKFIKADISDYDQVYNAIKNNNIKVVVHLAAVLEDKTVEEIKKCNVQGTKNIFKASSELGIERVVYASSIMVMHGYRRESAYKHIYDGSFSSVELPLSQITESAEPRLPENNFGSNKNQVAYAKSKLFGENLAKLYSKKSMSCICVRLGWITAENICNYKKISSNWCSKEDAVEILSLSITAPKTIKFGIYYGLSDNLPSRVLMFPSR